MDYSASCDPKHVGHASAQPKPLLIGKVGRDRTLQFGIEYEVPRMAALLVR